MGCVCSRVCIGETESPGVKQGASSGVQSVSSTDTPVANFAGVASQFVSDEGSRTVRVSSFNYELRYGYLSRRGYYPEELDKVNQDSFSITDSGSEDYLFAVFDGHGEFGSQCSQFARRWLSDHLFQHPMFHVDPVQALRAAFLLTNTQLRADSIDDSMSGTTSVVSLVRGKVLYVANAGDSRTVLAEEREGRVLTAVDLSIDHKPFRQDEMQRVKMCGARVMTLDQIEGLKDPSIKCWESEEGDDGGDPPRVWVPNGMFPGTAFTRSIGDAIAESVGVIPEPEIVTFELTEKHPFFVLASDGVFEFMSSQDVVDMIAKFQDPRDACAAVVAESHRLWLKYETRTDDITVIVVYINGLTATSTKASAVQSTMLRPNEPPISEQTGSEFSSTFCWNTGNQPVRHESSAKIRTGKSFPDNRNAVVPSSPVQRKTCEEEGHIKRALHDHFLFKNLSHSQYQLVVDCLQKIEVNSGEVVVKQGEEGDCFYVVGSGEFEVLATQGPNDQHRSLQQLTANNMPYFAESGIMHSKPHQATVRAMSSGSLWALKREDYQGILNSDFSTISSIAILRSVDFLSKLTIMQLSQVATSLSEVSYSDGQIIVDENDELSGLVIILKGRVKVTFYPELLSGHNVRSLKCDYVKEEDMGCSSLKYSLDKNSGSYFGEWSLIGEHVGSLRAIAVGDCVCSVLSKTNLFSAIGSSLCFLQDVDKVFEVENSSSYTRKEDLANVDFASSLKISFSDLEWKTCLHSTDCSEIGLVNIRGSGHMLTLKRYNKQKIKSSEKESQILKERNILRSVNKSAFISEVLGFSSDKRYASILLNVRLVCPLASILCAALDESSAKFCAASAVLALEQLHKNGILYRGISPDLLMIDHSGYLKLVDFRFAKMSSHRTYTICGIGDSLAPEMIQGKDHGYPVDWWALGVLIYYMLHGEMPFGYWKEKEVDTYAKISKGVLVFPPSFSPEAVDLITKLLEVNESNRLGSSGSDSVKKHPWFDGLEWDKIRDGHFPAPHEIIVRIKEHLDRHRSQEMVNTLLSPARDWEDSHGSEWLRDW